MNTAGSSKWSCPRERLGGRYHNRAAGRRGLRKDDAREQALPRPGGSFRVYKLLTPPGAERLRLGGHEHFVSSAAFSPDGGRLVTASFDRTARIWDATTGTEIKVLRGHDAFVRDGDQLDGLA
jgi:hypothetical protein